MAQNNIRNFEYRFVDKISIRPDKIVKYQEVFKFFNTPEANAAYMDKSNKNASKDSKVIHQGQNFDNIENDHVLPVDNRHSFQLSKKAVARIKEKVTWLYELARNKTITTTSGKVLSSFKMNFITLTLPSMQQHSTATIISTCLNQFLSELRLYSGLKNYVWRLEYQKNGNVHFHIATDSFIEFEYCRAVWNRCIEKLGYVTAYHDIFSKLSFSEYCARTNPDGKTDIKTLSERFSVGIRSNWRMPNSVDVRHVSNAKNIAFYISKYITKVSPIAVSESTIARDSDKSNMRLWYCSSGLSKLDKITFYIEECFELAEKAVQSISNYVYKLFDYCKCWYFSTKNQSNESKALFWELFHQYADSVGYEPA